MQPIKVSASFISIKEKAGTGKTSGKPYSFATLRAFIDGEVLDLSVNLEKVDMAIVRGLSAHDEIELEFVLIPSGKGGYEALEPRVQVVSVEAA